MAEGGVISFLQKLEGYGDKSLGRIRKELRAFLGDTEAVNWGRDLRQQIQNKLGTVTGGTPVERDGSKVRAVWQKLEPRVSQYLLGRGIDEATQKHFQADIRVGRDPSKVSFPTRDASGQVVGVEHKGAKAHALDERSSTHCEAGSVKGITRMGQHEKPTDIFYAEANIDLFSAWQKHGRPEGALLCATNGTVSQRARDEIAELARQNPQARHHIVMDNDSAKYKFDLIDGKNTVVRKDPPGERHAADVEAAIRAGNPAAQPERHQPPADYKDYNDWLTGKTRADIQKSVQEALFRCESPDAREVDRRKAADFRDREYESDRAKSLYEAQKSGHMTPDEVHHAIAAIGEAKHDREAMARVKAEQEAAERAAREEARRNAKWAMEQAASNQPGWTM